MARYFLRPMKTLGLLATLVWLVGCATPQQSSSDSGLSTPTRLSDAELELDLRQRLSDEDPAFADSGLRIVSVDARVLLVGTVEDERLVDLATQVARDFDRLRLLHNELVVSEPLAARVVASDQWISTRVKGRMIADTGLPTGDIKVVTFRGTVYLMGALSADNRQRALELAAEVSGVQRVVSLLDQLSG